MPNQNRGLVTGDCGLGCGGLTPAESDAFGGRDERRPAPGLVQAGLWSCVRCQGWPALLRVDLEISDSEASMVGVMVRFKSITLKYKKLYGFIFFQWFEMEFSDLSLTSQLKVPNLLVQV